MKISVFDLSVVKVRDGKDYCSFICRRNPFFHSYIEVFTGKNIVENEAAVVEPLIKYYSILERKNYKTGRALMLTQEELLEKYIDINKEKQDTLENDKEKTYPVAGLVVANLERIPGKIKEVGPLVETTEQKYLFEIVEEDGQIQYRELLTGSLFKDKEEYFDVPYIVNPEPLALYWQEEETEISSSLLLWLLNDINNPKITKRDAKEKKKELK